MNLLRWLLGLVCLVVAGGGAYGVWSYQRMSKQVAELEPVKLELATLQSNYTMLTKAVVVRDVTTATIRQGRVAITQRLDDVTKAEPDAARYLSERIPDSVRAPYLHPATTQR